MRERKARISPKHGQGRVVFSIRFVGGVRGPAAISSGRCLAPSWHETRQRQINSLVPLKRPNRTQENGF